MGEKNLLQKLEVEVLLSLLEWYDGNSNRHISGYYSEFPEYMNFSIKDSIHKLKCLGYLACNLSTLSRWEVILSPDCLSYFEKKGMRKELFEELPSNAINFQDLLVNVLKC